jgi:hypothetical protein
VLLQSVRISSCVLSLASRGFVSKNMSSEDNYESGQIRALIVSYDVGSRV